MLENEGVTYGSTIIENKMNAQGGGWFFVVNFSYMTLIDCVCIHIHRIFIQFSLQLK